MKIIAIGRNYAAHIAELNNERPSEPVIFMKPDTAVLRNNAPFYHPEFSNDIHFEVEVLLKINREGKYIDQKFANKYYNEVGIGIDFTARDIQAKCKEKGFPWEKAKGFNGSAPISSFQLKENFDLSNLDFSLKQNGEVKQEGNTSLMLWNFDEIISYISQFFTLKKGDIIFTGTPAGVGPTVVGDVLEAYIKEEKLLTVEIK